MRVYSRVRQGIRQRAWRTRPEPTWPGLVAGLLAEDRMALVITRHGRFQLLAMFAACVAALVVMWIFAPSLATWEDTSVFVFTVGPH
jgi:hypothetical protein